MIKKQSVWILRNNKKFEYFLYKFVYVVYDTEKKPNS